VLRVLSVDFPDLTILGWTPTHDQWVTATAVMVGAVIALLAMTLWRRARKAVLVAVVTAALLALWWRVAR